MLWAVIIAGGSGTRFWPKSRARLSKQFLKLSGRKTLLEDTAARIQGLIPRSRILVVTQKSKARLAARLLRLPLSQVIGEPAGRNTAPCAALAAALIIKKDRHAVLALLPADQHMSKPAVFKRLLKAASETASQKGLPVTFGIHPLQPYTGYGYLEKGGLAERRRGIKIYRLRRFHEKPSFKKACSFLRSGRFLWNSGIFVWRADRLLEAARRYQPKIWRLAVKIAAGKTNPGMRRHFPQMPSISIDYGLMEKMAGKILTLPAKMGWSDLGGWQSLWDFGPKDRDGNVCRGNGLLVDSRGNLIWSAGRLVVLLGVQNSVVVDTEDALLVCPREKAESIRKVVHALKENNLGKYL